CSSDLLIGARRDDLRLGQRLERLRQHARRDGRRQHRRGGDEANSKSHQALAISCCVAHVFGGSRKSIATPTMRSKPWKGLRSSLDSDSTYLAVANRPARSRVRLVPSEVQRCGSAASRSKADSVLTPLATRSLPAARMALERSRATSA